MAIEPVDTERCQGERLESTPFRVGGPAITRTRCSAKPFCIVTEKRPGPDGEHGHMSICPECYPQLLKQCGDDFFTVEWLALGEAPAC